MKTKSNAGFSLVELMVVVAIIGILATVAVPNFMKFQAKAKQANAKSELAGIYTAQKAFYVEHSSYDGSLTKVGFVPEGYAITADTNCPTTSAKPRIYAVGFSGALVDSNLGTEACTATPVVRYDSANAAGAAVNTAFGTVVGVVAAGQDGSFVAGAEGIITSGSTRVDTWTISNLNVLTNGQSGL